MRYPVIISRSCQILLLVIALNSCNEKPEPNEKLLSFLNDGISASTKALAEHNTGIHENFKKKLTDPVSRHRALDSELKVLKIRQISYEMKRYLDSINAFISSVPESEEKKEMSAGLFKKVISYQNELFTIDAYFKAYLSNMFPRFFSEFEPDNKSPETFYENYLSQPSPLGGLTAINKIINDVFRIENLLLNFINNSITNHINVFSKLNVLVNQNTTILQNDEILTISAGVGEYSSSSAPRIRINQKMIKVENGIAYYSEKIKGKPGKYSMPVQLVYKNQAGEDVSFVTDVEYEIGDCSTKQKE